MKKLCILILLSSTLAACSGNGNKEETSNDTTQTVAVPLPVETCTDPAAMEKIRKAIAVEHVVGLNDEELKAFREGKENAIGLQSYMVDTLFMEHCILSVHAFSEAMGAYPTSWNNYINFDMRTGDSLLPSTILNGTKMDQLIQLCDNKLQAQIAVGRNGLSGDELGTYNSMMNETDYTFKKRDLDHYYIKEHSITFVYPFEFIHALKALEPDGSITFNINEIKPFLKNDGLLEYWIK